MKDFEENMENRDSQFQTSSGEESELHVGGVDFQSPELEVPSDQENESHAEVHGKGRLRKLFGPLRKPLSAAGGWFKKRFDRFTWPVFILMLVLSFGMWYMIKLGDTYTTEIEVRIYIEDHEMTVPCVAKGKGTDLFLNRRGGKPIHLQWSNLDVEPSKDNPEYIVVSRESLRKAISAERHGLEIISIGAIPEIKL